MVFRFDRFLVPTNDESTSGGLFGITAILAVVTGLLIAGYGFVVVPQSVLGGLWIVAIGLSMMLSGLFATEWAGGRFGLSVVVRRRLSLAFAVLAMFLLVAFVVINYASFQSFESGSGSGS